MQTGRVFAVKVEEVHSGDDFVFLVDLGVDGLFKKTRCRLHGVDAPNAYKAKADTEAGVVRDEVRKVVASGRCSVELVSEGKGGWIVKLYVADIDGETVCVNDMLRERGYIYATGQDHRHDAKH